MATKKQTATATKKSGKAPAVKDLKAKKTVAGGAASCGVSGNFRTKRMTP